VKHFKQDLRQVERQRRPDREQFYRPSINFYETPRRSDGVPPDAAGAVPTIAPTPRAVRSREAWQGMTSLPGAMADADDRPRAGFLTAA
jgi:hypothetical protein